MYGTIFMVTGNEYFEVTWEVEYRWTKPLMSSYLDPPEGGVELVSGPEPVSITMYFDDDDMEPVEVSLNEFPEFAASVAIDCEMPTDYDCILKVESDVVARLEQ